ncbi:MAG: PCRF domain-containing protein [Collinsella sp.]
MLFKMYMKYCARRGWKVTVNDCPAAEVIGIDRGHHHGRGQGRIRHAPR